MTRPSLRWLILLPTLLVFMLGFGSFAFYIDSVERENLLADVDDELVRAERASNLDEPGRQNPAPRDPPGVAPGEEASPPELDDDVDPPVQLRLSADGAVLASSGAGNPFSDATLRDLATRSGTFTVDEPRLRVRATASADGTVVVTALPLDLLDDSVADFRRTLLAGGVVVLALVAAVVWFITARAARPVTRMAATATRIADGELQRDVDPPSGSHETADLSVALDRMLTSLRSTIEDREHAAQASDEARAAMQRFLADVSHELRTPLTALKGYSDLYTGGMLAEPGALDRAMARIGDESERLNALVTDMLQLARDAPLAEAHQPVDVVEIAAVVVEDLRAAHPDVEIELDAEPGSHGDVAGQADRLHQAILNFGSNACQHTAPHSSVRFAVWSTATDLVVAVSDHGPGVDLAETHKIFLPFYRPETSRNRDGRGGAGLGLAIAGQIIERHGGTITVEPTPGGGATFVITVPLAVTPQPAAAPPAEVRRETTSPADRGAR